MGPDVNKFLRLMGLGCQRRVPLVLETRQIWLLFPYCPLASSELTRLSVDSAPQRVVINRSGLPAHSLRLDYGPNSAVQTEVKQLCSGVKAGSSFVSQAPVLHRQEPRDPGQPLSSSTSLGEERAGVPVPGCSLGTGSKKLLMGWRLQSCHCLLVVHSSRPGSTEYSFIGE